jgi:RNA methyltransferase, TrmH family
VTAPLRCPLRPSSVSVVCMACLRLKLPMITSAASARVKAIRELHNRKGRQEQQSYLVEGIRLMEEALDAGVLPAAVYVNAERLAAAPRGAALLARLQSSGPPPQEMSLPAMSAAADTQTPQGILAVLPLPALQLPRQALNEPGLVVILDGMQDPGNLGTILRTAWAAGVGAVITSPGCADVYAPKTVRAGMGAHFRLSVLPAVPWGEMPRVLAGRQVLLAVTQGGTPYSLVDWRKPTAVIIGGEARGVGPEARDLATAEVSIPMSAGVESLNAAVAAGVLLFEAFKQRSMP